MTRWARPTPTLRERVVNAGPDIVRMGTLGMGPAAVAIYNRRQAEEARDARYAQGPDPSTAPRSFSIPEAPAVPVASPAINEILGGLARGEIDIVQALEMANREARPGTRDRETFLAALERSPIARQRIDLSKSRGQ